MSTFLERLILEEQELDTKIKALDDFVSSSKVFADLSEVNRLLLHKQLDIMIEYNDILKIRIELLNK